MRKALLPVFLFAFLVAPAAALASGDDGGGGNRQTSPRGVAVQQCKTERAQMGRLAFQQKYGTPHAFKNCVLANGGSAKTDDPNGDQKVHRKHKNDHGSGDQNGEQKASRKHHKADQNGDHKGSKKHHTSDSNGDQKSHND
jgi:hypothetical protein